MEYLCQFFFLRLLIFLLMILVLDPDDLIHSFVCPTVQQKYTHAWVHKILDHNRIHFFHMVLLPHAHSKFLQQLIRIVVVLGGGDDGDIHSLCVLDPVPVNLRKNGLVIHANGVVSVAIESG